MKAVKHISFFYIENRLQYVNNIIAATNKYELETDLFIHTNVETLSSASFLQYTNGELRIIYHDLSNINPFYLTWKCRELLKIQRSEYDIFMYVEDDILVPYKAIEYWLKYNEKLLEYNYNLGFVRIEVGSDHEEYITDLCGEFDKIDRFIDIGAEKYGINNKNPYCAFWIYNKKEFNRFVESEYYNIQNIPGYYIRESSAIGLHGNSNYWYKHTLIPIIEDKLIEDCKIYHMSNNYVSDNSNSFATVKFTEAL